MGSVQEIHDRDREEIRRLGPLVLAYLHDRHGGRAIDPADEVEWGLVRFRIEIGPTPIIVTLRVEP